MTRFKPNKLPTLLLITDSPVTRVFFEEAVSKLEDYSLICSNSSIDAFDSMHKTYVSFIVIDENTPYIDLAVMCMKIRKLKEHQHTPILIITAHLKKSFTRRLLKAGATDFLREPLEQDEFFHRMEMANEIKKTKEKMSSLSSRFPVGPSQSTTMDERVVLDDRAVKLISNALADETALALLLIEIDQYDHFHKAHGTKAGSGLLLDFQDHLQKLMRGQDLLFSQKKGKFLVLLPRTSSKAAQFIAENIQESLEMVTFHSGEIAFNLTISIGLVTLDEEGSKTKSASFNFDRLMQAANNCLNEAKKKGNAIVAHLPKRGSPS